MHTDSDTVARRYLENVCTGKKNKKFSRRPVEYIRLEMVSVSIRFNYIYTFEDTSRARSCA